MPKKKKREANPYYLTILTCTLSGVISVVGIQITSTIQEKNAYHQKQYELKANAYNAFSSNQSPVIVEILNVGDLVKQVGTDTEIQTLENNFQELVLLNQEYRISCQLDSDFNVLRLHGSEKVKIYCDDILAVLALSEHTVDWGGYPEELQAFVKKWKEAQSGVAYFEPRVTNDERVMMVILCAMYKNLINELRSELYNTSLSLKEL
jgi:hypothetical protein